MKDRTEYYRQRYLKNLEENRRKRREYQRKRKGLKKKDTILDKIFRMVNPKSYNPPSPYCVDCGVVIEKQFANQVRCGSTKDKTGCAWKYNKEYHKTYDGKRINRPRASAEYLREQYKKNPRYKRRQLAKHRKYMKKYLKTIKKNPRKWRKLLEYRNRKRRERYRLKKLGIYRDRRLFENKGYAKNPLGAKIEKSTLRPLTKEQARIKYETSVALLS